MSKKNKIIFITGAAGFIGYHLILYLIKQNYTVYGFDNLNSYYDVNLKISRINDVKNNVVNPKQFSFIKGDLTDAKSLENAIFKSNPDIVIHLAAQAGVRYSLENPKSYVDSNLVGFVNILEILKDKPISHFIFASSSSVYGGNDLIPFNEKDNVDHPVSLYGATKKANELLAHTYSHLYNLPSTGLRFFTVYGPWGRPDMAIFLFTKSIIKKEAIKVFNNGNMRRDFTYIDDVVYSIFKLMDKPPSKNKDFSLNDLNPSNSWAPYQIFNIGNANSVNLMDFIEVIEEELGKKAIKEFHKLQDGDVKSSEAHTRNLEEYIGFIPKTSLKEGVSKFVLWYKEYYGIED